MTRAFAIVSIVAAAAWLVPAAVVAQERPFDWGMGMHPMWWAWGAGGATSGAGVWLLCGSGFAASTICG